jgi:hypothetical protein
MPAAARVLIALLPAVALLAACTANPPPRETVAVAPPPPPPSLPGALGAPVGPATAPPMAGSTVPRPPAIPLGAADVTAALDGNTAQGVTANGLPYAAYFSTSGAERFREGAFSDNGTWRVLPDGRLCSSLQRLSGDVEQCYLMYRSGNALTFQRADGATAGSVTVVSGNPLNL